MERPPTQLIVHTHEPDQEVVDNLRKLLERAEAGEITGFVAAYESTGNVIGLSRWGRMDQVAVVAHLERLKFDLLLEMTEMAEDV